MLPVIIDLSQGDLGLPLQPLVWAVAFGVCLGGIYIYTYIHIHIFLGQDKLKSNNEYFFTKYSKFDYHWTNTPVVILQS